jgi:hemolysin III
MQPAVSERHPFPDYSAGERVLDRALHVAGLVLAGAGVPLLLVFGIGRAGAGVALGLALYGAGLLAMFAFSAAYNLARRPRAKEILRRFDRASIFVMIAGTYSPFALNKIAQSQGHGLFALVWSLAAVGVAISFALPRRSDRIALVLYLAMGWSLVAVLESVVDAVSPAVFALLIAGGVVYTLGVALHLARNLRYHNALWHACVLVAAICHFLAVFWASAGTTA